MLKKPKKQSYSRKDLFSLPEKISLLRTFLCFFLLFALYIILPIYLAAYLRNLSPRILFIFYSINILFSAYLFNKNSKLKNLMNLKAGGLQEKINILSDRNLQEAQNNSSILEKIKRYNSLKEIIEKINQDLSLDYIADNLSGIAFSLVSGNKGACILYLADNQTQKLSIFKTKKEDKGLIIKTKEGDIFDLWVLRHASPLLVEDARRDFRFDSEKLSQQDTRPVLSLISCPLISENKFLGIIRLDSPLPGFYAQDDLRLLSVLSDIGAVALENGELFQKTQDLAIHDGLTSLYTKGYFIERLKEECKRSLRKGSGLSLLMFDIDYFKNYNDQFGHASGDIVLKNLSFNIKEFLKGLNPLVSRFGGEEFCVLLSGKNKVEAHAIAEELRKKIEKIKISLRRQESGISVSIGVSALLEDAADDEELMRNADRAMYEAKQKGRNRVVSA